jgi:type I restriction enzyme S subunit
MKLRHIAGIRNSNVDKVSNPNETVVRLCNYVDVYKNDFITNDMPFMQGTATQKEIDAFRLRVGDVIITKDSEDRMDIGVPALVRSTAEDLVCGYHLTMLRPNKDYILGEYLFWALQTQGTQHAFANSAFGVTRYGLSMGAMKSIDIPTPVLHTQRQIADFLNHETGRVDALIEKKLNMASLLSDKRRVSIEDEIRKSGGRPYKLKYLATIRKGRATATEADDRKHHALVTMDYLRTGNPTHYIDQKTSDIVVGDGDCLVVWDGSNAGEIILARKGILSSTIAKIVPNKRIDRDYLFFALKAAEKSLRDSCNGMGIPHVDGSMLKNIIVPMLDLERQKEIAASLMEKTANIDRAIALTRTSIERLKEYRAALITEAVTGQINVTTYKAGQMTPNTSEADDTTDQATTNTA